jgi:hypothetical protein
MVVDLIAVSKMHRQPYLEFERRDKAEAEFLISPVPLCPYKVPTLPPEDML